MAVSNALYMYRSYLNISKIQKLLFLKRDCEDRKFFESKDKHLEVLLSKYNLRMSNEEVFSALILI
jgi:hypothetical protein